MTELDCHVVTLCGWQDVKIPITNSLFSIYNESVCIVFYKKKSDSPLSEDCIDLDTLPDTVVLRRYYRMHYALPHLDNVFWALDKEDYKRNKNT